MTRSSRSLLKAFAAVTLLVTALGGCVQAPPTPSVAPTPTPAPRLPVLVSSFADVAQKVLPAIVYIVAESNNATAFGSGVVLRPDGYILTNKHVVAGARRVLVSLYDGRTYRSTGVWEDYTMDLAAIKIPGNGLPTVPFADPAGVQVGDLVLAIGHALGMSPDEGGASVSLGIVSNLDRSLIIGDEVYYDLIQTDAAINHGNSGGALVNMYGEVIGINSAVVENAQSVGYAINVATARHVYNDLVAFGEPRHPYLGVNATDTLPLTRGGTGIPRQSLIDRQLSLSLTRDGAGVLPAGALITKVVSGSPAGAAGLLPDDVIVQVGEERIKSAAGLMRAVWRLQQGDKVLVRVQRGGIEIEAYVTLSTAPKARVI